MAAVATSAHVNSLPSAWVSRRLRIKGAPVEFFSTTDPHKYRPWMAGILNDSHPVKVSLKPRQIGFSELAVMEELWLAATMGGINVMHTFPRLTQVQDFSQSRFDASVNAAPKLAAMKADPWNVGLKCIQAPGLQPSYVFFRSSWSEAIGEGVNADMLVLDEYDRMKPGVEDAFTQALKSSRLRWLRYYSTPTLPGRGVAALYDRSDRRRYLYRCPACNHDQALAWEANVEQVRGDADVIALARANSDMAIEDGTFQLLCAACRCRLPDLRDLRSRWVAEFPSRTDIHGYSLSHLDCAWISPDDIARDAARMSKQAWNNYVLGRPFAGDSVMLDETAVLAMEDRALVASTYRRDSDAVITAGIDWGEMNWVLVLARGRGELVPRIIDVAWFSDTSRPLAQVDEIAAYLAPFRPDAVVADFGYGQDRNPALARKVANFWACRYPGGSGATTRADMDPKWNLKEREVVVERSSALKWLAERIRSGQLRSAPLPETKRALVRQHFTSLAIDRSVQSETGDVIESVERTGPDHLYHSCLYATIGMDRFRHGGVSVGAVDVSGGGGRHPFRPPMPPGTLGGGGFFR